MLSYENVPEELKRLPQWVVHKYKKPFNPATGEMAKVNAPQTWSSFEAAVEVFNASKKYDGIGFMFNGNNIVGIDLDHVLNPKTGEVDPEVDRIIRELNSYTEVSPSGTGLHIYVYGDLPENGRKTSLKNGAVEMYKVGRYFTVTGNVHGAPRQIEQREDKLLTLYNECFGKPTAKTEKTVDHAPVCAVDWWQPVIDKALKYKSKDPAEPCLDDYWNGDFSKANFDTGDESAKDLGLMNKLAYYLRPKGDKDYVIEAMIEAFKSSPYAEGKDPEHRRKTYEREDYIRRTAERAYTDGIKDELDFDWCFEKGGRVYKRDGKGGEKLIANFTTRLLSVVSHDDGLQQPVKCWRMSGQVKLEQGDVCSLPEITLDVPKIPSMDWVHSWSAGATIYGRGNKELYLNYIKAQCGLSIDETVYTHTGFRAVNGNLCFLSNNNTINGENITCQLQGLENYAFVKRPEDLTDQKAVMAVVSLMSIAPKMVSYSLLGFTYLAPLTNFLRAIGKRPSFVLYCKGRTGSLKTSTALLYLSHFTTYSGMSTVAPGNFQSTANRLEYQASMLKDVVYLVDDYCPSKDARTKAKMDDTFQRLIRGQGDQAVRGRMTSELSARADYVPRGLVMATGEATPNIDESGLARLWSVEFERDSIKDMSAFTVCQEEATRGVYNIAMQGYIKWIIGNAKGLDDYLNGVIGTYTLRLKDFKSEHRRSPQIIIILMCGIHCFTEYAVQTGTMTMHEAEIMREDALQTFFALGEHQAEELKESTASYSFVSTIQGLFTAGRVNLLLRGKGEDVENPAVRNNILCSTDYNLGYYDKDYLYLLPDETQKAYRQAIKDGGGFEWRDKNTIYRDLKAEGIMLSGNDGKSTVKIRLPEGGTIRVMKLSRKAWQKLLDLDEEAPSSSQKDKQALNVSTIA